MANDSMQNQSVIPIETRHDVTKCIKQSSMSHLGQKRKFMAMAATDAYSAKAARPFTPASRQLHGQERSVNLAPSNTEDAVPL
jgi:hypothetical protein